MADRTVVGHGTPLTPVGGGEEYHHPPFASGVLTPDESGGYAAVMKPIQTTVAPPSVLTPAPTTMPGTERPVGYHIASIQRGVFGEPSKIVEEANEFADAIAQGSSIMALVELSDLLGAIKGWLAKHHPSLTIFDLGIMSDITTRAFENGARSPKA